MKWTAHRPPAQDGAPHAPSITLVNDAVSGLPIGIVESGLLTPMRTAAVSALVLAAAGHGLRNVAVLGAGVQARMHLRMLARMFPALQAVSVWNRGFARGRALVAELRSHSPWPLDCHAALGDALRDADSRHHLHQCRAAVAGFGRDAAWAAGDADRL